MSSRTKMRQQIERMKVMEEEKSQTNANPKAQNNNFRNTFKNGNEHMSFDNTYLPSLSYPVSGGNPNYDFCDYSNNPNNIQFNQDTPINCIDFDEFIALDNNYHRRNDSPYLVSPACQYDKYSIIQYSDFVMDNKPELALQYRDITSKSLLQPPYEVINNKNEISLSCPVTGERSEVSINHAMSSCNFPPTPSSSSVQGQYQNDNLKNQKDRSKKESHNKIERKRREYINQQITELGKLIPPEMNPDNESKKNKGNILKNSVEYVIRLKNEFNNISNYLKETEMAFMLLEGYRKRNQELESQNKTYSNLNTTSTVDSQNLATNYHNYLLLHEQNQKLYQSNGKQIYPKTSKPINADTNRRLGPIKDKQISPLENQIAFKIEPSSAHSSGGNNSLSTTHRIEEVDLQFNLSHEMINTRNTFQITNNNHPSLPSLPSMHIDSNFSLNTHFRCMDSHKYESMEC